MTIAGLTRSMTIALATLFLAVALPACEEQGPAEQTGEAIDNTVEKSADVVEQGAQAVEEGAQKLEEGAEQVQKSAD